MMKFSFKFLPIKDLFYSVFPTVGTYGGYLQGIAPNIFPNVWIAIGIGIVLSVILAIIFYRENVKAYKKALAEILATGYFMNFTGRFEKLLNTKTPIQFLFPEDVTKTFHAEQIAIEIGMPSNLEALTAYSAMVQKQYDIVYIREATFSEPFWVRAAHDGNRLHIYEFPRTLFSLSKYLKEDFSTPQKAQKNSKKIYAMFWQKIQQLRIEHVNDIATDQLNFITL